MEIVSFCRPTEKCNRWKRAGRGSSARDGRCRSDRKFRKFPYLSPHGDLRDTHGHSHRGMDPRRRHRSRCKGDHVLGPFFPIRRVFGNDCPGGIPGPGFRPFVRWRRAVLHILQDPILASVPGRSLEFMNLSEVSGGIFREISHDPFLRSDRQGVEVSEGVGPRVCQLSSEAFLFRGQRVEPLIPSWFHGIREADGSGNPGNVRRSPAPRAPSGRALPG